MGDATLKAACGGGVMMMSPLCSLAVVRLSSSSSFVFLLPIADALHPVISQTCFDSVPQKPVALAMPHAQGGR